jgi:hypothetical protein
MSRGSGPARVAAAVAATLLLTGCGGLSDEEVREVAADFAAGGAEERCELLAPATLAALVQRESSTCAEAIEQVPLGSGEVTEVQVWGEEAQAKLSDDTFFLTRTSSGWRVMAAACTHQGQEKPYDCQVEGA